MKKYMFVLAFENRNATDYVTEKLPQARAHTRASRTGRSARRNAPDRLNADVRQQAFQGLAVPVYMGTTVIDDWLPGDHSIIKVCRPTDAREQHPPR